MPDSSRPRNTHAHAHTDPDAHADAEAEAEADADSDAYAHTDADANSDTRAYAHTYSDAHTYTRAYADSDAGSADPAQLSRWRAHRLPDRPRRKRGNLRDGLRWQRPDQPDKQSGQRQGAVMGQWRENCL